MFWITLFLFVPIFVVGLIVARALRPEVPPTGTKQGYDSQEWERRVANRRNGQTAARIAACVGLALAIVFTALSTLTSIDQGQVGVQVLFGRTIGTLDPGLQFKNPFAKVVRYDTRPIETSYLDEVREGDRLWEDAILTFSLENASITADLTVLWHIDPAMAETVYALGGKNQEMVKEIIVRPVTRSRARDCIGQFRFEEARTTAIDAVERCMVDHMSADLAHRGIVVEEILLRQLKATPELQMAIEQKLQAEQAIQTAEFNRQQAEIDKQTTIIQAEAQAEVVRIAAQAAADANDLEGASLRRNPQIVSLRIVEALGDHSVVLLPTEGGVQPIIALPE